MTFVPLNLQTVKLVLVSDASFANSKEIGSQLVYFICLEDDTVQANFIHYGYNRCRRALGSVMASKFHALVLCFGYIFIIQHFVSEFLGRKFPVEAYTDNHTLFTVIAKDAPRTERRLQLNVFAIRESYSKGELSHFGWIPGRENIADPLNKAVLSQSSPVLNVVRSNKLDVNPLWWTDVSRHQ